MTGPSKTDWSPAEVWERAAAVFEANSHEPVGAYGLLCIASRAILAERERCAAVAHDHLAHATKFAQDEAQSCSAAIRGS